MTAAETDRQAVILAAIFASVAWSEWRNRSTCVELAGIRLKSPIGCRRSKFDKRMVATTSAVRPGSAENLTTLSPDAVARCPGFDIQDHDQMITQQHHEGVDG